MSKSRKSPRASWRVDVFIEIAPSNTRSYPLARRVKVDFSEETAARQAASDYAEKLNAAMMSAAAGGFEVVTIENLSVRSCDIVSHQIKVKPPRVNTVVGKVIVDDDDDD